MYEITIHRTFSAAHAIRLYDGSLEGVHGHNWSVEVTVASAELDGIEVVMDFHLLEQRVESILAAMNNRHLNQIEPFADGRVNPTAERVAWWIGSQVGKGLPPGVRLVAARVGEAPGCVASYRPQA